MAGLTKTNGFGNYVTGSVRTHGMDIAFYKLTVRSTGDGNNTPVDLRAADGDAAGEANQIVELIVSGTGAVASFTATGTAGSMALVFDHNNHSAASIAVAVEALAGVGTDTIVEVADQLTFK